MITFQIFTPNPGFSGTCCLLVYCTITINAVVNFSGMGMSSSSSQPVEIEVLIGVLTAVTLILLFLFLVVLVYSKRRKFLQSPTSRRAVLNPFPVQINMKELLTASPILSGGETTNR